MGNIRFKFQLKKQVLARFYLCTDEPSTDFIIPEISLGAYPLLIVEFCPYFPPISSNFSQANLTLDHEPESSGTTESRLRGDDKTCVCLLYTSSWNRAVFSFTCPKF